MRIAIALSLIILTAGCIDQGTAPDELIFNETYSAEQSCILLCQAEKEAGTDISAGPCLSNEITPDWVCDVAHSPRQDIDNLPENQCSAFREGKAHHFVEVDENCALIKSR